MSLATAVISSAVEPDARESREYFVSVRDSGRNGFLLGPYETHAEALAQVANGRERAIKANSWAHFYAFGTCSAPAGLVKKTIFGR